MEPERDPPPAPAGPTDPMVDGHYALPPADLVVALRVVGTPIELALAPDRHTFTLGSAPTPKVDLHVSSRLVYGPGALEHVSRLHLILRRSGNKLAVRDQRSTNGTKFRDSAESEEFVVTAGVAFSPGNVTLLTLDEALRALRPHLAWAIGLEAHATVDAAIETIATGKPLAFVGPAGGEAATLAAHVHRASVRRDHAFVALDGPPPATRAEQDALLARAAVGTLFLDVDQTATWPAHLVRALFDPADPRRPRPIVAAPDLETVARRLGQEVASQLGVPLALPALAERRADHTRLLDELFRRAGGAHALADLADLVEDLAPLAAYPWPGNLAEMIHEAPRLYALVQHRGNVRAAARALGLTHPSILKLLDRLGLVLRKRR